MRRKITISGPFLPNTGSATLVVSNHGGITVEDKNPSHESDDYFIRNFITDAINMDSWKHSMHVSVSAARRRRSPERKKIREIIEGKIRTREEQVAMLNDALIVLGRWA